MRKVTGAAVESWALTGGAIMISDAEAWRTTQSMPLMTWHITASFSWIASWSALFAAKSKMQARSLGPVTVPSHVAMTIGSMSSKSCVLCLRCVWEKPSVGLEVWGGKVPRQGEIVWIVVFRRCSDAMARWAWRLGVILAVG